MKSVPRDKDVLNRGWNSLRSTWLNETETKTKTSKSSKLKWQTNSSTFVSHHLLTAKKISHPKIMKISNHEYLYVIPMLVLMVKSERSVFPEYGYYSYHPAYDHDLPPNRPLPAKIPFGMPLGGYSQEGRGPPYGLVAFYFEAYGHRFDFNNPWNMFLLKQLIRLSSEITAKFVPFSAGVENMNLLSTKILSKFLPVDNSLMDGPLIWKWSQFSLRK